MTASTLTSVEEYLETSYRPDCEFIDGQVSERNMGESDHSDLQTFIIGYLWSRQKALGIHVLAEQRLQITPTRFRVPDVLVSLTRVTDLIVAEPPFLCVEILSRRDTWSSVQERIDDYLSFGVKFVWVIDPRTLRAHIYTRDAIREVKDGVLRTENPDLSVPILPADAR